MSSLGRIDVNSPVKLICNEDYSVLVEVKYEVEDCATADYDAAYKRALAIADASLGAVECKDPACAPPLKRVVARQWLCNAKTLEMRVKFMVACPSAGARPHWNGKEHLADPTPAELTKSQTKPDNAKFDNPDVEIDDPGGKALICLGPKTGYTLHYTQSYDCDEFKKKKTHGDVERPARKWAEALANLSFFCPPPCTTLHVTSSVIGGPTCNGDRVDVEVEIQAWCT
jgi:hypothetical protein